MCVCVCITEAESDGANLGRGACVSVCRGSFSRQRQADIIVSKGLVFVRGREPPCIKTRLHTRFQLKPELPKETKFDRTVTSSPKR